MSAVQDGRASRKTIREIASLAGVSIATVSRVLNDRPDVSPGTREIVLQHVRAQNYNANRSARALGGGRTGLIGLMLPVVYAEYFSAIMSGAAKELQEHDMRFVLCPTWHEHDREVSLLEHIMHGTTDASMLLLPAESSEELRELQTQDYPFVVVDPREPLGDGIPVVACAHAAGAKAAVDHLIALGHTRIAAITGPSTWTATIERMNGYLTAMAAIGIIPPPEYVAEADYVMPGGYLAARKLLSLPDRPTAIFAFNDNMAIGTYRAAREMGLHIPHDLSIVGFDDAEISRIVTPELTTVRQPLEEMGSMGASLLTRVLEGERVDALRVDLAARLIVRDSTAPPARS